MSSFLEGSLESFPLSAVLRFLVQQQKEGRIRVGGRDRSAELHLRSGPRFAVRCDDPAFGIPTLLVKRELISEPEAAQLEAEMKSSGGALENSQRYSSEELKNFARVQAHEILYDAMTWESGQFRWTDEQTMPAGLHLFELDLDAAEKEAARRGKAAIDQSMPSPGARFRVSPQPEGSSVTIAGEELSLLLDLANGSNFDDLVAGAGGDSARVARMIQRLRVRGLIEDEALDAGADLKTAAPVPQEAAPVPEAQPEPQRAADPFPETGQAEPEVDRFDATSRSTPERDVWSTSTEPPPPPPQRSTYPGAEIESDPLKITSGDAELPFAVITLDDDTKTSFPILEDQNQIGRGDHNAIRIPHGSISGTHARIDRTKEGYRLHDLNSRNGTFVNGDRIETALLNNNDRIRLGTVYMTFSVAAELEPSATVMTKIPKP